MTYGPVDIGYAPDTNASKINKIIQLNLVHQL